MYYVVEQCFKKIKFHDCKLVEYSYVSHSDVFNVGLQTL